MHGRQTNLKRTRAPPISCRAMPENKIPLHMRVNIYCRIENCTESCILRVISAFFRLRAQLKSRILLSKPAVSSVVYLVFIKRLFACELSLYALLRLIQSYAPSCLNTYAHPQKFPVYICLHSLAISPCRNIAVFVNAKSATFSRLYLSYLRRCFRI